MEVLLDRRMWRRPRAVSVTAGCSASYGDGRSSRSRVMVSVRVGMEWRDSPQSVEKSSA